LGRGEPYPNHNLEELKGAPLISFLLCGGIKQGLLLALVIIILRVVD
jgi:hypothetical protein